MKNSVSASDLPPVVAQSSCNEPSSFLSSLKQPSLLLDVIEDLLNGILLLTEQGHLIYLNHYAQQIIRKLNPAESVEIVLPKEIWHVCQSLIQSRTLFPNQRWLMESEVLVDADIVLHIRVQWINLQEIDRPCLLLVLKDHQYLMRNVILEETQKYGLTAREREIWGLYRANHSYKDIANELGITLHTVKKHIKSIRAKQKKFLI
ncbi:helix-turn-helix transcriptional regulator [Alkalinema sp. FACHB-956]|uniref:helix-turn-helix transcriptional regulator n=1 Tax=Alkalinema sp. FACHB-956 TaxID=2692768 RepID=UPI0016834AB1|nr:helix-turn-helix transcriptional regulator [Alkalinema sp. FACHB-956]MBD2326314.1 helix-turn-helix transcriptional regulator [Alkalinema sp. FACHB-956]